MIAPRRGITLLEILVLLSLAAVLVSMSIPPVGYGLTKSPMTGTLSNMKQLHLATQQMTMDHEGDGNPIRWTCSKTSPLTLDQWKHALVDGKYLTDVELKKMLSVTSDRQFFGTKTIEEGFHVFAVTGMDPEDTVLFATKNWHGPKAKEISGEPYGTKGMIVFRKGSSGIILQARQTSNLSLIGGGGMHNYLPLRD